MAQNGWNFVIADTIIALATETANNINVVVQAVIAIITAIMLFAKKQRRW